MRQPSSTAACERFNSDETALAASCPCGTTPENPLLTVLPPGNHHWATAGGSPRVAIYNRNVLITASITKKPISALGTQCIRPVRRLRYWLHIYSSRPATRAEQRVQFQAMKQANVDLKTQFKSIRIDDIEVRANTQQQTT